MLHIHFGAGRLGLGLVAPFFQTDSSELHLLNRATSGQRETRSTAIEPTRRNELLSTNPDRTYVVQAPKAPVDEIAAVRYDGYHLYADPREVGALVGKMVRDSSQVEHGVMVTASILKAASYSAVISALNTLCKIKERSGCPANVFLVACENTLSAHEVLNLDQIRPLVCAEAHRNLRCVDALVDRMCVSLEEHPGGVPPALHPTVAARAERYGVLKLALSGGGDEDLVELCRGSKVQFSRYLDVEKQIKGWLLNGSHWLIALSAFEASHGDVGLQLNDFLNDGPHGCFAREVLREMRDGIEILLRREPQYAEFVLNVDVGRYLDDAESAVMERFRTTEDSIARILARFRAPSCEDVTTIQSFTKRFLDRIDQPIAAYQREKGRPPAAASQGLFSLYHLLASGTFVEASGGGAPDGGRQQGSIDHAAGGGDFRLRRGADRQRDRRLPNRGSRTHAVRLNDHGR